ncbi:hypothetical protein [Aminobacter sp. J44]|nr:hypothetical protein [Aminobacter sp. J44]
MTIRLQHIMADRIAVTPSTRTRHSELLILCARIGYSPPLSD